MNSQSESAKNAPRAETPVRIRLLLDWNIVIERYGRDAKCCPSIEPDSLPLARSTVDALWTWYCHFSAVCFGDPRDNYNQLDDEIEYKLIDAEGLRLWAMVQAELGPAWEVYFHSEVYLTTFASLSDYAAFARSIRHLPIGSRGLGP